MKDKVVSLAEWKAKHPPALVFWNHGLECALAWQKLWLNVFYRR